MQAYSKWKEYYIIVNIERELCPLRFCRNFSTVALNYRKKVKVDSAFLSPPPFVETTNFNLQICVLQTGIHNIINVLY